MTDLIKKLLAADPPVDISTEGWVRTTRSGKNVTFLELNDAQVSITDNLRKEYS